MEILSNFFILGCLGFVFLKFVLPLLVRQQKQSQSIPAHAPSVNINRPINIMAQIDAMDGREFEHYLGMLFRYLGYQVEVTRYMGDFGADLVLRQGEVRAVVQAKRYRQYVGIKAVQEVVAAKGMYRCSEAIVVTNSRFTEAALSLARANNVVLWDRHRLREAALNLQRHTESSQGQVVQHQHSPLPSTSFRTHPPQLSYPGQSAPSSAMPPPTNQAAKSAYTCASCGRLISPRVGEFCLDRPERFGGRTYCMHHQKFIRSGI